MTGDLSEVRRRGWALERLPQRRLGGAHHLSPRQRPAARARGPALDRRRRRTRQPRRLRQPALRRGLHRAGRGHRRGHARRRRLDRRRRPAGDAGLADRPRRPPDRHHRLRRRRADGAAERARARRDQRRRARHRHQRRGAPDRQHPRGREDPRHLPRRLRRLGRRSAAPSRSRSTSTASCSNRRSKSTARPSSAAATCWSERAGAGSAASLRPCRPCSRCPTSPRGATGAPGASGDRLRPWRHAARPPLPTPTTTAPSSPSPAEPGQLLEALLAGRRGGDRDDRHVGLRGSAPGGRRARRLPAGLARPRRPRGRAQRGGRGGGADRRARRAGLPLRRAGPRPGPRPSAPTSATAASPELWLRMEAGELRPDFGPPLPHPTAGATLVTARPPLAAFNVELDSGDLELARAVAAGLRESGGGCRGCGRSAWSWATAAARSRPTSTTRSRCRWRRWSSECGSWRRRSAPGRWRPSWSAWCPAGALAGYPADVPMRGFDPERHLIERRLASARPTKFSQWHKPRRSASASTRGTQGGRIDGKPRSRPRTRAEAKARASAQRKPAQRRRPAADLAQLDHPRAHRGGDLHRPPAAFSSNARSGSPSASALFMLAFYIPAGYFIDMTLWRRSASGLGSAREGE